MDGRKRALLLHHQRSLVEDLDVSYIIDYLFTRNVITNEEFDHIFSLKNRVDQTRFLIDTIAQTGTNETYEAFLDSLQKDYRWLWEKLAVNINESTMNDSFEDSLSRGDVPRLPDHYVERVVVEQNVADKLKLLARHNILVLHGMSGSGKTSVVVGVLRNNSELITANFNGAVFWLNLDDTKTDDDIIAQQNKLYRKTTSIYTPNSYMNSSISMSSIGSNADTQSLSSYEWTWQELRDRLKKQFSEPTLKEALLVLDDVKQKKCVEAFDIGCKILITTGDTDVVATFNPQIIKIENNFTERETLEFFASCLDVGVNKLPRQAKKLHEICKGSPFHITLLGAQLAENKERLTDDPRAWNYYLSRLEKKEFFFLTRNNNNPMKTIEVCINSLKPNILALFKTLSILPDNAKISAKVLSKLWNKEVNEVESIMKQLRSKSLIMEFYDHEQRNYIYEIHDLIMNYLRTRTSEEDLKKLHGEFLKSYNYDDVAKAPVDIVDDGYIAFYIGYHILNTRNLNQKWQLFNRLFLDLKFLGNKVRLTGPADVIDDLQKYESYIAADDFDREFLSNMKCYLIAHGSDLFRYPCTDVVQSILQHGVKGNLYTKAMQIATEQCEKNELYFDFLHEQNVENITPSNIDVKEAISSVGFLGDYALVGTMAGVIKFFHISTNKLKKELPGTGHAIKWVGACPVNPPVVAALSFCTVITVWYIDDLGQDDSEHVIEEEPEECLNNYQSNVTIPPKRGAFINCRWANNQELLITHTTKLILLYDPTGNLIKVIDVIDREREILCCIPCNNDRYVIVATTNSTNALEVIDLTTKEKVIAYEETDIVIDLLTVPGQNRIITLKEKEVSEHEFKHNLGFANWNMCRCKKVISCDDVKPELTFLSMAVNKSGTILFVSTKDSRIICIDLKTHNRLLNLENKRGDVVSMSVSEVLDDFMPGSDVLLTGTGSVENSAKVWYLDAAYVAQSARNGKSRLTTKFDVSFMHGQAPLTPNTPSAGAGPHSAGHTPRRHQSFVTHREVAKEVLKPTMSLDRHALKPLMLKGICNGNSEDGAQPLLAVVDDKNNIQIMRGRKVLPEIPAKTEEQITTIKISPCNQFIFYGLKNGSVVRYTLRTKESRVILDVYSPVQYLNFVNADVLIVAGKNKCLMAYKLMSDGVWKPVMMQAGDTFLGSQEILNDIQGKKKLSPPSDRLSRSGSDDSISSKDRKFPNRDSRGLAKGSGLVDCFWVRELGLITVECNATVKLWDKELKLLSVLNGRQTDVQVNCTALQNNLLVLCDDESGFQTFELRLTDSKPELRLLQQYKLNNRIMSCDVTADGLILAMGLHSGDVVVWNVPGKRQLRLLKHHKTRVQFCSFSPVPERMFRSPNLNTSLNSPAPLAHPPAYADGDDEQPPLVLVTMASEIVWWNVTYLIKMRANKAYWRIGWNAVTPVASPLSPANEARSELTSQIHNLSLDDHGNFFFGDGPASAQHCWKAIWKRKTYKEGSKRKEILACIKLSGMTAKKLCHDDKFSCFVTVDNPGTIHIMNVMRNT